VARITIEDCLEKVNNRFALIQLAFQRVKQLRNGAPRLVQTKNKEVVGALREIAAGLVTLEQVQPALPEGQDLKLLNEG
jgi:DNA-directed RNA polymerase subunit omega